MIAPRRIREYWWAPLSLVLACAPVAVPQQQTAGPENPHLSASLVPSPTLSPHDVIAIQIEAFRHNDERDRGIEVAFRFASPANKRNTGPLPRFIDTIKNGPYRLMLHFKQVAYEPVEVVDKLARQRVILFGETTSMSYVFYLSRQEREPYVDCWMTDRVTIQPVDGRQARVRALGQQPFQYSSASVTPSRFRSPKRSFSMSGTAASQVGRRKRAAAPGDAGLMTRREVP